MSNKWIPHNIDPVKSGARIFFNILTVHHTWEKSWRISKSHLALWNMTVNLYYHKEFNQLLIFFHEEELNIPENYLPFYYKILCLSAGQLGKENLYWEYYTFMKQNHRSTKGEDFFTIAIWNEFASDIKNIPLKTSKLILADIQKKYLKNI